MLRKNNFREQIYDDPLIDKETFLRRKLRKIFNLKADDFETLREFNDYQEKWVFPFFIKKFIWKIKFSRFETIVYNLVFEENVEQTKKEIEQFEEKHKEQIDRNKRR